VHEQVDVVGFAVELAQLGAEAGADVTRDLFAASQDGVGERAAPIFGDEDQMGVQTVDDTAVLCGYWDLAAIVVA
jgi:hypothetical protein